MQKIVFIIILAIVSFLAYRSYSKIIRNIKLGKDEKIEGQAGKRWQNVMLVAFGQSKMFKRFIPAIFHLFIYVAFIFTQIELIEILVDGVFGVHRFFADKIGLLYPVIINTIEILSVLAFIATIIFLWRRNIIKVPRFDKPEMKGWPTRDANIILFLEIILIIGIFSMNGADILLQRADPEHFKDTGTLFMSSAVGDTLFSGLSVSSLHILERAGWWLHIMVVFAFILYLPISKHLHIIFAFPNVYFQRLKSRGEMDNMPAIMNEVKSMMGLTEDT
ncbi:MAG: Fe-S oxidoreductase, partial [Bacteroidia bacterium]|nr:Fe-S oxidoreductase [Bacteroidia bacterium]